MKKILCTALILSLVTVAQAQDSFDPLHDRQLYFDILNISAILTGMYLIASFILQIFRQHYNYRIKNRILDKGTEENVVRQILQPDKKENKNYKLQWFFALLSIGIGLILHNVSRGQREMKRLAYLAAGAVSPTAAHAAPDFTARSARADKAR